MTLRPVIHFSGWGSATLLLGLASLLFFELANFDPSFGSAPALTVASEAPVASHAAPVIVDVAQPHVVAAQQDTAPVEAGFNLASATHASVKTVTATHNVSPPEDGCLFLQECIDQYLWSLYERAAKIDTVSVHERYQVIVKDKKGKEQTVTKTRTKLIDEDFAWKDPKAAEKMGMSMPLYVIGGMEKSFRAKLYRLMRAADKIGLAPGITSGFRDDYRQSIASGHKAATDRSYHGGSLRGGYGHGLAADVVSTVGATRDERRITTEQLWKWVDKHGVEFSIGRPYLDRDPPHVGPIDGNEYIVKRTLFVRRTS